MIKQSKITVKHYLNLRLKPDMQKNTETYPVFCMIIFNRMTIRVRSNTYLTLSIKEFENINKNKDVLKAVNFEIETIKKIVELFAKHKESKQISKKYLNFNYRKSYKSKNEELNLLNSYIDFYTETIYESVTNTIHKNIVNELKSKIDNAFIVDEKIKESIVKLLYDNDIFSDFTKKENVIFFNNNLSLETKKLILFDCIMSYYFQYFEIKSGYYFGFAFYYWYFEHKKVIEYLNKYILNDKAIIDLSDKLQINFNESTIKELELFINSIVFDDDYHLKYKIS